MKARTINLHDVASALGEMEPATKALGNLDSAGKARVSMAISCRRIADALEKLSGKRGAGE